MHLPLICMKCRVCDWQAVRDVCLRTGDATQQDAYLNAAVKAALPTAEAPKEMQRTSAVGHCTATQGAVRVAIDPPIQKPTHTTRRGATCPEVHNDRSISEHTACREMQCYAIQHASDAYCLICTNKDSLQHTEHVMSWKFKQCTMPEAHVLGMMQVQLTQMPALLGLAPG